MQTLGYSPGFLKSAFGGLVNSDLNVEFRSPSRPSYVQEIIINH